MSRVRHDSIAAEKLALNWHKFGTVISAFAATACFGCAAVALAGIFWHRWAEKQHAQAILDMEAELVAAQLDDFEAHHCGEGCDPEEERMVFVREDDLTDEMKEAIKRGDIKVEKVHEA